MEEDFTPDGASKNGAPANGATPESEAPAEHDSSSEQNSASEERSEPEASPGKHPQPLAPVVEAMAFAADKPATPERISEIYAEVTGRPAPKKEEIEEAVEELNASYASAGRAFRIQRWAGGYRMATRPELSPFVQALFAGDRQQRLSRSLMETLAVVAYRQPVTRPEVDFVRGVSADYAIRKLLEYGLVDVKGRSDSIGRPLLYVTTQHFMEQFGLDSLDDLPTLREVEELLDNPNFNKERAKLLDLRTDAPSEDGAGEDRGTDEDK